MSIDDKEISVLLKEDLKRYSYTPREYVLKKIDSLSPKNLKYQINIIQMVWACYYDNDNFSEKVYPLKLYSDSKELKNIIPRYLKELEGMSNDKRYWQSLSIRYDSHGIATVSPLNYDLYDGLAGIGILFCAAYKNGFISEKGIISRIERSMNKLYKRYPWKGNWSIFHGRFSYIRYWWLKERIMNISQNSFEKDLIEICTELKKELIDNKYLPCDYIGGLAGVVSFLVDVYNEKENVRHFLKDIIVESVKYILAPIIIGKQDFVPCDFNKDKFLAGFAHGITGIVYAIAKAVKSINELQKIEIINTLNHLLNKENSLFDEDRLLWIDNRGNEKKEALTTWCSGAAGILLGRKEINRFETGVIADRIKETRDIVLKSAYTQGYGNSLCHGSIGNLMILKYLSLNDQTISGTTKRMINLLENDYLKYGIQTGYKYNNPSLSFFLGIPGEIYGLMYLYYDKNLPIILL